MPPPSPRNPSENLNGIGIFVKLAESRSFTVAASRLAMSPSGVSKAITRMEGRLGVRLVNRTTRSISITQEGEIYLNHCLRLLEELDGAAAAIFQAQSVPSGRLRVQLPRGLGPKIIIPALHKFLAQYPEVELDIVLDGRNLNLVDEGIDVAVRFGEPPDNRLIARKMCRIHYLLCASPSYLASHGVPRTPQELYDHSCIDYVRPQTGRPREWVLTKDGNTQSVLVPGKINFNDILAMHDAAVSGIGIAYLTDCVAAESLRRGRLKVVLPEYMHEGSPAYLTYVENRQVPQRMRVFIDFLLQLLPTDPPWTEVVRESIAADAGAGASCKNALAASSPLPNAG